MDELAVEAKVRIETQHQALNAVVRFYAEVLGRKVEGVEGYPGAQNTDGLFPPPPGGTALAGSLAAGCPGFALQPRLRNPDVRGKWLASNYVGLEERGAGKAAHRFRISRK